MHIFRKSAASCSCYSLCWSQWLMSKQTLLAWSNPHLSAQKLNCDIWKHIFTLFFWCKNCSFTGCVMGGVMWCEWLEYQQVKNVSLHCLKNNTKNHFFISSWGCTENQLFIHGYSVKRKKPGWILSSVLHNCGNHKGQMSSFFFFLNLNNRTVFLMHSIYLLTRFKRQRDEWSRYEFNSSSEWICCLLSLCVRYCTSTFTF